MGRARKLIRNLSIALVWGTIGTLFVLAWVKRTHRPVEYGDSRYEVLDGGHRRFLPRPELTLAAEDEPDAIRARFILSGANCPLLYHPKTTQMLNGDFEVICWRGDNRMGPHIQYRKIPSGGRIVVYAGRFDRDREGEYARWNEAGEKIETGFNGNGRFSAAPGDLAF